MAWVRLADDFADHPKVVAAGPLAGWLWVCALGWSNRYLTDGFIPDGQVGRLADVKSASRHAARLVEVGLWERVEGGFMIHDYRDYQPTAETVRLHREQTAARVALWRRRQQRNAVTNPPGNGAPVPGPVPDPVPVPGPGPGSPPRPPSRRGERASTVAIPDDLTPPTEADRELWSAARERLTDGWLPSNAEKSRAVEVLGRDSASGGLWLRVPAEARAIASWHQLVGALVEAGDAAGADVVIVEG